MTLLHHQHPTPGPLQTRKQRLKEELEARERSRAAPPELPFGMPFQPEIDPIPALDALEPNAVYKTIAYRNTLIESYEGEWGSGPMFIDDVFRYQYDSARCFCSCSSACLCVGVCDSWLVVCKTDTTRRRCTRSC